MKDNDTVQLAIQRLAAECSRSEHCSGEMMDKMRRWELTEQEQAQVMAYLIENKYVDDARYARLFVSDKMRFNKWGPRKIEQVLWQKHVNESVYRPFLDAVSKEEWQAVLSPLLQSKRKSVRASSDYELRMKLIRFAMSRGFTMDIIERCI